MSNPVIKVFVPAAVAEPRGASWVAAAAVWLARVLFVPHAKLPS
jgi:uncharacterized membrane protein YtjA (UPF0391 family)